MITVPLNPPLALCITLETKACLSSSGSISNSLEAITNEFSPLRATLHPPRVSSGFSSNSTEKKTYHSMIKKSNVCSNVVCIEWDLHHLPTLPKCNTAATVV